jgi:hypothetical protein
MNGELQITQELLAINLSGWHWGGAELDTRGAGRIT